MQSSRNQPNASMHERANGGRCPAPTHSARKAQVPPPAELRTVPEPFLVNGFSAQQPITPGRTFLAGHICHPNALMMTCYCCTAKACRYARPGADKGGDTFSASYSCSCRPSKRINPPEKTRSRTLSNNEGNEMGLHVYLHAGAALTTRSSIDRSQPVFYVHAYRCVVGNPACLVKGSSLRGSRGRDK